MALFIEIILGMPTGIYTVLLGFISVYWFFTLLGVVDLDFLDVDGAVEGLEGAADGVLEGVEVGDVDLEGGTSGGLFVTVLNFFNLRAVPLTIALSLVVLFSWAVSYLGSRFLLSLIPIPMLGESLIFFGSLFFGAFIASWILRPFEGKFVTHQARKIESYLGTTCTITSSRVDGGFGEAKIPNPNGAPLLMQVRCMQGNGLKKGKEALVISRDVKAKTLIVEPLK